MKLSKINLFGSLALGCSLMAGGLAQASASPLVADNRTDSQFVPKVKNGALCSGVIANVKEVLETIPNVKVLSDSGFVDLDTSVRTADFTRSYQLNIEGEESDFWKSAKELKREITEQITENCEGTRAVVFSAPSLVLDIYGRFSDGSIKEFTCDNASSDAIFRKPYAKFCGF